MAPFTLRPSALLAFSFGAAHAAAAAFVVPLEIPLFAKAALWAAIGIGAFRTVSRHGLLLDRQAIVSGWIDAAGGATVHFRDGRSVAAEVLGTTYVTPGLTVLNFRVREERRACCAVLYSGNVGGEDFRRLRVLLKWGRSADRAAGAAMPNEDSVP